MTEAYIRYISLLTLSLSIVYSLPIAMTMRKTRKEKTIAQLRRKLSQTEKISTPAKKSIAQPALYSYAYHNEKQTQVSYNNPFFYTDLIKTIMVTTTILGIEIILYFFLK